MVERSPEKAGVGGSIPSLATISSLHSRRMGHPHSGLISENQNETWGTWHSRNTDQPLSQFFHANVEMVESLGCFVLNLIR